MYRRIVLVTVAAVLTLLGLPTTGAANTVNAPEHYVALGDSYASGPGIPEQRADPIGCQRSTHNYPALLAQALGIRDYTDISCGGAKTDDMTAPQPVRLGHATGGRSRGGRGQDGQLTGNPAGLAKRMATVVPVGPVCVLRTSARWRAIQMPLPRRASVLGR